MKVNLGGAPTGETKGETVCVGSGTLWRTPSGSRQGKFHFTLVKDDGSYPMCTCEGYSYRGRCKHTESLWGSEQEEGPG